MEQQYMIAPLIVAGYFGIGAYCASRVGVWAWRREKDRVDAKNKRWEHYHSLDEPDVSIVYASVTFVVLLWPVVFPVWYICAKVFEADIPKPPKPDPIETQLKQDKPASAKQLARRQAPRPGSWDGNND
jgi:hypothetical protein